MKFLNLKGGISKLTLTFDVNGFNNFILIDNNEFQYRCEDPILKSIH